MNIIEAYPHEGHPYWKKGEWKLKWKDGDWINFPGNHGHAWANDCHMIDFRTDGIYYVPCHASSGLGKVRQEEKAFKILDRRDYDGLVKMGEEKPFSEQLNNDLKELGL